MYRGKGQSGKSTILKSIIGLTKFTSGEIKINNISVNDEKFKEIIDSIGMVFEKDALFDGMKVWENIMFKSLNEFEDLKLIKKSQNILKKLTFY